MECADAVDLSRTYGLIERGPDEALRGKIVDLLRPGRLQQSNARSRIGDVAHGQAKIRVIKDTQFFETPWVERTRSPIGPVHSISLVEQKPSEVGTVLT
jgi:hypothetical protein